MERHLRSHKPVTCVQCLFVDDDSKEPRDHLIPGDEAEQATECDVESPQPQGSCRPKRKKRKSNSSNASSLPREYIAEGAENIYRTHTCPTCRRCFKTRSHLQEHLHLHFPQPSLQCPTCKRHFTSKSKLRTHRLREAGEKTHRCHLCEYSAVERNAIRRHVVSMHADAAQDAMNTQSFPCPTCGQSFGQSKSLKVHMKTHNITPVACFQEACPFQTSVRREILKHTVDVHGVKAVECRHRTCGAIFKQESDMETHYRTHLAYHCSQCDFSSSNKNLLLQHRRLGHAGSERLGCDFCSFVTFNPVEFQQHVEHLHASEKIHRCAQCSYVTSHKRGLKRHVLMHSGEKPHKCPLCDFRCRDESYLSRHMLTHSDDKNFMCAECGYVTKWKHYLNVHMRKHAGDLRYRCDQCPYRCHRMDQLNSHKLRHQAKSLMCEICAYACKRKYELRNHMMAKHCAEERAPPVYRCKYCTYQTSYRQALKNHENCKHTKLREFRCALCFYSSFSSISLFLHKRKTHGYVPGDKTWLENYAAKERERNAAELVEDFYKKSSSAQEQPEESAEGERPAAEGQQTAEDEVVREAPPTEAEEYCTLILTTLSTADYPTSSEENCANQTASGTCQGKKNLASSTSSSEEDEEAEPREECDVDDSTAKSAESGQCHGGDGETTSISCSSPVQNPTLESEVRLKALKKLDKEQAEAMVMEGRVQLIMAPNKDVRGCEDCSCETSEETNSNCRCRGNKKEHACQACGARFKHRRSLDSHHRKKCPTLRKKTGTFSCISEKCPDPEESCNQKDKEGCTRTAEETKPDPNPISTEPEGFGDGSSAGLLNRPNKTRNNRIGKKRLAPRSKNRGAPLYTQTDGKFKCRLCKFSSVRLTTVERHLTTCQKKQCRTGTNPILSVLDGDERKDSPGRSQKKANIPSKKVCQRNKVEVKRLRCQLCGFSCAQRRRLTQHVALRHKGQRPHRCRFCPFSTRRRYRLDEHESLHTGLGRHACDVCDKTFGAASKLRQHKIRIHKGKEPAHFCSVCDFSGYTPDDVRRHELRCHTGELNHACSDCDARFSSETALRNHCKRVHPVHAGFRCDECEFTCGSQVALKSHQQQHKHHPLQCSSCQESFLAKESLDLHQRVHLTHRCPLCSFATKTRKLFAQHLAAAHEGGAPEDKPLRCSTCSFACRHQPVLELHLRSHGGRRLYKCSQCEYSSGNKQKITWHLRIHTGEKPYGCERCSYACADPSRLKLHMRVHQEEKKYLCPECGYKCKWATQLKYHMTKHTGEKPYACDECDYRTNRADALRSHRDTQHCDTRPYVCEKCGKAFKTTFILKTHQRQHSDGRPYACGLCDKAFRWPAGLRHHFLSHTKQQPFSCRHCAYRAKQKFQVVKHLRRHHPEAAVEQGVVKHAEAVSLTLKEALQGALQGRGEEEAPGQTDSETRD